MDDGLVKVSPEHIVGHCDVCDGDIYEWDTYYELPDEDDTVLVCDNGDCEFKWLRRYRTFGRRKTR